MLQINHLSHTPIFTRCAIVYPPLCPLMDRFGACLALVPLAKISAHEKKCPLIAGSIVENTSDYYSRRRAYENNVFGRFLLFCFSHLWRNNIFKKRFNHDNRNFIFILAHKSHNVFFSLTLNFKVLITPTDHEFRIQSPEL